jgi:thiol-disulfide isomerase/thioredoxin
MNYQLLAVAVVGIVVLAAACVEALRAMSARRLAARATGEVATEPYIIYFTGDGCTVCKTHQEPALAKLPGTRIDKVDALEQRELAERFKVYTLPTTVVMTAGGETLHVNYGYAPATKLQRQLSEARAAAPMRAATA